MIRLCRLNGDEVYLNTDLVATVEAHHDTVVTLVDGKTYVVRDTASEVVAAITHYRASVLALAERLGDESTGAPIAPAGEEPTGRLLVLRSASDPDGGR